jgi:hypothetical protein
MWFRIETSGGVLEITCGTAGFRELRSVSWLRDKLLASKEGHCSMALVRYLKVGSAFFAIHEVHLSFR